MDVAARARETIISFLTDSAQLPDSVLYGFDRYSQMRGSLVVCIMLFRIEFLTETTDGKSVSLTHEVDAATLTGAEEFAWAHALGAWGALKANGFQIRDMTNGGEIVAWETFL